MIKVIETKYKGYRFRSRLEARWAVFFDALGLKWEYEKEGFDLDGISYLPDFWLSQYRLWVEIKPEPPSEDESLKLVKLRRLKGDSVLLLSGQPWPGEYRGILLDKHNEVFDFERVTELARCRRCEGLSWLYDSGGDFSAGSFGPCCDTERYPIPIPEDFYEQARTTRFERLQTSR